MPGGDLATKEPWRMALSYLLSTYGEIPEDVKAFEGITENELRLVGQAAMKGINAPLTSSCGRLFDAVAALIGLRQKVTFEGQAAMQLEMIADTTQSQPYPYLLSHEAGQIIFDPSEMIGAIIKDHFTGTSAAQVSGRFHLTLAMMVAEICVQIRQQRGLSLVALSGGVFQNCLLTELTLSQLEKSGFKVLTHSLVPPNDGGLALGQAVVASRSPVSMPV
jgi:hydrogenase maturation protein HypF